MAPALPSLEKSTKKYPSGIFNDLGEHLHILTDNASEYVVPPKTAEKTCRIACIVVPTHRNILKNRKKIKNILRLARAHGASNILFLCSGEAKRADVLRLASKFEDVSWVAVDGPFSHEQQYGFKTTRSPIACGSERDLAQKRNFALQLARLMGWESIFLLDDDIDISPAHLAKAAELLSGNTAVVGFSAREYPDHSVVVHASRWVHAPIDAFVGGGALAVKISSPHLSFFPHIYNDDWLFLLSYCLLDQGGLTWAGTIKQGRYNPFKNVERAKSEEPGDLLAESLMRLAMAMKTERLLSPTLADTLASIRVSAGKEFWEHEINQRILFIRNTEAMVRHNKMPSRKKRQALRSLAHSLNTLTGGNGLWGLSAETLAAWTKAWIEDTAAWNKLLHSFPSCRSLEEAFAYLKCPNAYTYSRATVSLKSNPTEKVEEIYVPAELEGLPRIPRSPEWLRGLHSTKIIESFHSSKGMKLQSVIDSAARLRFDRPTSWIGGEPALTIGMLVANGESQDQVSASIQNIRRWLPENISLQVILWVYTLSGQESSRLHWYRDCLVARIIPEIVGTNIRLRSMVSQAKTNNIDHFIDDTLVGAAMAYWLEEVEGDHQMFVVNSNNELLRKGTLWEFVQQQHTVPSQPLQAYLQHIKLPLRLLTGEEMPDYNDEQVLVQARRNLAVMPGRRMWPTSWNTPATKGLVRSMRRAKLSWLKLDDITHELMMHTNQAAQLGTALPENVYVIPVLFSHTLMSDIYASAKDITEKIAAEVRQARSIECMIIIYGGRNASWRQLQDFRVELMQLTEAQYERSNVVLASLVCHPECANTRAKAQLVADAVVRYFYWMLNHRHRPVIHWHKD